MKITWIGAQEFLLQSKEGAVCINPQSAEQLTGKAPAIECEVICSTTKKVNKDRLKDDEAFVINGAGEYSIKGIEIDAHAAWNDTENGKKEGRGLIFVITLEGMRCAVLSEIGTSLTNKQIEDIGDIDILLVPIAGTEYQSPKRAEEHINNIEPRVCIPYLTQHTQEACAKIEEFKRERSFDEEHQDKADIKKAKLPQDDMQIIILNPVVKCPE